MSEPSRKTHVVPTNTSLPDAPQAEVRIAHDLLFVTLCLPGIRLADTVLFVRENKLSIRSIPGRGNLSLDYTLPTRTQNGLYVAREVNGVWDITILRPSLKSD